MTDLQIRVSAVCFVAAAIISGPTTVVIRRWARRRGFVDRPGGHKSHEQPVALLGGIAVVAGVLLPMLAAPVIAKLIQQYGVDWTPIELRPHLPGLIAKTRIALAVVAGGMVLHVLGLVDDLRPLSAAPKLIVQILVAAFLVIGFDVRLLTAAGSFPSTLLSILWIVTLTNAFNFLDNMDGLVGGVAMIAAAAFAVAAMRAGQIFVPACCWLLVGALAGFLPFNLHPASIYLGDAGSLLIGYLIAVFTILTTFYDPSLSRHPFGLLAPLVVMAVPLYDTTSVMLLRWRAGRPLWHPDRRHFSHRLQERGLSVREAVGVIWLATALTAVPSVLLSTASWGLAIGILLQAMAVVALVAYLEKAAPHDR
ncbi:MAG: MraY family glycosyltransferase [Phycisphaerae bacterium]